MFVSNHAIAADAVVVFVVAVVGWVFVKMRWNV